MKPDIAFLINCCQINPSDSVINQTSDYLGHQDNKELLSLISLAHSHGVFPLVYKAISTYISEHRTSSEFDYLKQANLSIVMQNMRMTAELFRISDTLLENGITLLPFKGPTLAQIAYGDITQRQYGDLDVWVDRKDIYKAAELIVEQGYEPMGSISFLKNGLKLDIEKNYEFYKKTNGTKLEIHWRLTSSYFARKFENYNYQQDTMDVAINGLKTKTIETTTLLIYLCLHGSSHMWERLEWISDLDRLISNTSDSIDWEKTIDLASKLKCTMPLLLGLGLTIDFFGTTLPCNLEKRLLDDKAITKKVEAIKTAFNEDVIFDDHESKEKNLKVFMFQLGLLEQFSDKIGFVTHSIFGISDRDVMVLDLPKHLFFLYYPIRIGRILYKYTVSPILAIGGSHIKSREISEQ